MRVAVVQQSERPTEIFRLNTHQTKEEVLRAVNAMQPVGGRSLNMGSGLKFVKEITFSDKFGSRAAQKVPQFLIVLSGGRSRDSVKEPAGILKTEGVMPFGVGVKDADRKQIEAISHNPSFAFTVKEFSELSTITQNLNNYVSLPKEELSIVLQQGKQPFFFYWPPSFHSFLVRITKSYLLCLSTKQCCKKRYCVPSGWL